MITAGSSGIGVVEGVRVPERTVIEEDTGEVVLEAVPEGVAAALADVEPEIDSEGLDAGAILDAGAGEAIA